MSKLKRPPGVEESAELMRIWVKVFENGVSFRFHRGAGVGVRRDNPDYYATVGEWFCNEVDALSTLNRCVHGVPGGYWCPLCESDKARGGTGGQGA